MIITVTYTSIFDDDLKCSSSAKYDTASGVVFDIEPAENAKEADRSNYRERGWPA